MNGTIQETRRWSRQRWYGYVALAFAAHVGLIFAFGSRKAIVPRTVANVPTLQLATRLTERQQLDDPTLFALPHPRGFAGASWLPVEKIAFDPFRWTEPPRLLPLPIEQLGVTFLRHVQSNRLTVLANHLLPLPPPAKLEPGEPRFPARRNSSLRVNGGLANRRWLNPPTDLPAWPAADPLTNSVVQVLTDASGQVVSPILLPPGSGSKPADTYALELARGARFAPRRGTETTVGTLIFEWNTVPLVETNPPATKP